MPNDNDQHEAKAPDADQMLQRRRPERASDEDRGGGPGCGGVAGTPAELFPTRITRIEPNRRDLRLTKGVDVLHSYAVDHLNLAQSNAEDRMNLCRSRFAGLSKTKAHS
jgi:hypothetical protein